jgi:hypothetical protein
VCLPTVQAGAPSTQKSIFFTAAFLTSGGGFLYFNRQIFGATQFNSTAQLGAGVPVFTSRHHSIDFGYKYHHISNANPGRINLGLDPHVVLVAVSFVP